MRPEKDLVFINMKNKTNKLFYTKAQKCLKMRQFGCFHISTGQHIEYNFQHIKYRLCHTHFKHRLCHTPRTQIVSHFSNTDCVTLFKHRLCHPFQTQTVSHISNTDCVALFKHRQCHAFQTQTVYRTFNRLLLAS